VFRTVAETQRHQGRQTKALRNKPDQRSLHLWVHAGAVMSIFSEIISKIFHAAGASPPPSTPAPPAASKPAASPNSPPGASQPSPSSPPAQTGQKSTVPSQPVDVEKVLTDLAAKKGGGGNWRTSIVDLLKLLDLDSSLSARKALGQELGVHAGADGSAEQNIALQKAVWAKLAENGGQVPASLHG
jgi:hypothetical protein